VKIESARDLEAHKQSYALAMEIFHLSNSFPEREKYALTSQILRSSRSVPMNLREAWAKRRYEAHFISKLTDCDGENGETETSLHFARDCGYISDGEFERLLAANRSIGRLLGAMILNPSPFLLRK